MGTFITIFNYLLRILPGLLLVALVFILVKPNHLVRIILYIFSFILLRDSMTPLGLWSFGAPDGIFWIRLSSDPFFLIIFGVSCLFIALTLFYVDKENRKYFVLFTENKFVGLLLGVIACFIVVAPFPFLYQRLDVSIRGGSVDSSLLLPILIFAIFGNFLEEGIFRGYVLGVLKEQKSRLVAGVYSGIVFALCHTFLATTVTNIGYPLLIFTLWEGIIAGLVGARYGLIPATLTHGGAIFFLSSGLI